MTIRSKRQQDQVSAIILAGGQSSRMGSDKALLRLNNETMLERIVRVVEPMVGNIVIMLSQTLALPPSMTFNQQKIQIGRDKEKEQGPLQGIADGCSLMPEKAGFVFVLSCDLPFVSNEWLQKLLDKIKQNKSIDAVCSQQGGYLNPLLAVYQFAALNKAQSLLNQGKRSCLALLDDCRVSSLQPAGDEKHLVSNINTPEEYQQALRLLP